MQVVPISTGSALNTIDAPRSMALDGHHWDTQGVCLCCEQDVDLPRQQKRNELVHLICRVCDKGCGYANNLLQVGQGHVRALMQKGPRLTKVDSTKRNTRFET